jgi:hypothetical protein
MKMRSMGKAIKSSESLKQLEQRQHTDETNQKFDRTSLSSTHPSNANVRAAYVFQKKNDVLLKEGVSSYMKSSFKLGIAIHREILSQMCITHYVKKSTHLCTPINRQVIL